MTEREFQHIIAEEIGQQGLTCSGIESAARRIAALRRTEPKGNYTAWLIELNEQSGPMYFQFVYDDDWTKDHDMATHFCRKEDAERVIDYYGWTEAKVVEHMWPSPGER